MCLYFLLSGFLHTAFAQQDFVRLQDLDSTFFYDMRYASSNNFLKEKVYECGDCIIRKEVADSLIKANYYFKELGYRIMFFDCYRPLDVQKKMWKVLPNPTYVADPAKGSIHNRGGAVDITLATTNGQSLDMGTDFDHFGKEAHHSYQELGATVLSNRKLLKEGMMKFGFFPIRSEWWHYNFGSASKYAVSNFTVKCN
ncbi:MAG: M15 family metallopeptidase [Bacteroidota bacterium]